MVTTRPQDGEEDVVSAVVRRGSVGWGLLASNNLSACNALNLLATRWSLILMGNLSRNKPRNRLPGTSASERRANMASIQAVRQWSHCQCERVEEDTSLALRSSKGVVDEDTEPIIRLLTEITIFCGSFVQHDRIWYGIEWFQWFQHFQRQTLHEGTRGRGLLSKIWEFDGSLGEVLSGGHPLIRYDAVEYITIICPESIHWMFEVVEKSLYWLALYNCMFKVNKSCKHLSDQY